MYSTLKQHVMKACAWQTCAVYVGYIFIWHSLIKVLDVLCLALRYHKRSLFFEFFIYFIQKLVVFQANVRPCRGSGGDEKKSYLFFFSPPKYCLVKFS